MSRAVRLLPWGLFALALMAWVAGAVYDPLSDEVTGLLDRVWGFSFLAFPLVGLFLARRFPTNPVGWLFIVGPALVGAGVSLGEYGEAGDVDVVGLSDGVFLIGELLLFAALVLFPDGRYPSRWLKLTHVALLVGLPVSALLTGDQLTGILVFGNFLLPIIALVYRGVRGDGVVRRQIAGPTLVVLLGTIGLGVTAALLPEPEGEWLAIVFIVLMTVGTPVAIAVAITRYRLYEIDRLVSRTVSYTLVVGILAAVFFAGVALVTRLLPAQSDLAVAASTLAVAALFNPIRRKVQGWVDRRFDRSKYDTQRVMDGFATTLNDRVDPDGVLDGWVDVVSQTMQPSATGIWVRGAR